MDAQEIINESKLTDHELADINITKLLREEKINERNRNTTTN